MTVKIGEILNGAWRVESKTYDAASHLKITLKNVFNSREFIITKDAYASILAKKSQVSVYIARAIKQAKREGFYASY